MATMPLVAPAPWKYAEDFAKSEDDLYKMFQQQAFTAEQNDLTRAQQSNMQQNLFGQQNSLANTNFENQRTLQNDRIDAYGAAAGAPPKLIEKMKEKMQFLMQRGVPQHVAAALVGNAAQESAIDFSRTGDGGASYGEYQFNRNGEAPGYERWLAQNNRQNDSTSQREYVLEQLQKGNFRGLYDKMVASNDPAAAAELFSREYERPNPKFANNEKRRKYATQAYTLYGIRPNDTKSAEATNQPSSESATASSTPSQPSTSERQPSSTTETKPSAAAPATKVEKVIGPDGKVKYVLKQG